MTDADVFWDKDAARYLLEPFRDPLVGVTCAQVKPRGGEHNLCSHLARIRCSVWHRVRMGQHCDGRKVTPSGYLYAMRASASSPWPDHVICDDLYVAVTLGRSARSVYQPRAVVEPIFPRCLGDYVRQRVRNAVGRSALQMLDSRYVSQLKDDLMLGSFRELRRRRTGGLASGLLHLLAETTSRAISPACALSKAYTYLGEPIPSTKHEWPGVGSTSMV